jgi:nitrate reductase NapE component
MMRNDEACTVKLTKMNIFETVLGILLVLAVGMCVGAFSFVLWMLFGGEPRSRHYSRQRPIRTRGRSSQKAPAKYDEAAE